MARREIPLTSQQAATLTALQHAYDMAEAKLRAALDMVLGGAGLTRARVHGVGGNPPALVVEIDEEGAE